MSGNQNKRVNSLRLSSGNNLQRTRVTKSVSELNGFFKQKRRPSDPQIEDPSVEQLQQQSEPHNTRSHIFLKRKQSSHDADEFVPIREAKKELKKSDNLKHRASSTGKRTDTLITSKLFKSSKSIKNLVNIAEYPPDEASTEPHYEIPIPDHETRYFNYKAHPLDDRQLQWIHPYCKGNSPSERKNHTAAVVGNFLYVIAGTDGENVQNQAYALDLTSYTWKQLEALGSVPAHRYGHSCTVVGTNLIVFGGRNKTMVLNDLYAFDTVTSTWHKIAPQFPLPGRAHHRAYHFQGRIFFIGGIDKTGDTSDLIIEYKIVNNSWEYITIDKFSGRAKFSLAELDEGKVLLVGGYRSSKKSILKSEKLCKHFIIIDFFYNTVVHHQKLSGLLKLTDLTAVGFDSSVLIFGGRNKHCENNRDIYILTYKDRQWNLSVSDPSGTAPDPLHGHTMVIHRNSLVVFAGKDTDISNKCYLLQIGDLSSNSHSPDLFATLTGPFREQFNKQAKLLPKISMEEIAGAERIAAGASGVVKKAIWKNRYVVLKEYFNHDNETFEAEVKILAGLHHPNIVEILGTITESNIIVLEYLPLGDLFNFCKKQQETFSWPFIMSVALGVATGMSYLHQFNILHRDLKSLNLLVKSTNPKEPITVKLMDFGDSKVIYQYSSKNHICGTARWTAPEVFNQEPYTPKSDVYSFGIILWELLTQGQPFNDIQRDFQIADAVMLGARPPIPGDCPAGYKALMQACWHQKPQTRPTFDQIILVLDELKTRLPGCSIDSYYDPNGEA